MRHTLCPEKHFVGGSRTARQPQISHAYYPIAKHGEIFLNPGNNAEKQGSPGKSWDVLSDAAGVTVSRYRREPASRSGDQRADLVSGSVCS